MAGAFSRDPPLPSSAPRIGQLFVVVGNAAENFLIPFLEKTGCALCVAIAFSPYPIFNVSFFFSLSLFIFPNRHFIPFYQKISSNLKENKYRDKLTKWSRKFSEHFMCI